MPYLYLVQKHPGCLIRKVCAEVLVLSRREIEEFLKTTHTQVRFSLR